MKFLDLLFSSLLSVLVSCTSCSPEEKNPETVGKLEITPSELSLSYEKGVRTVVVEANCDWGVSLETGSWCSVSPSGGVKGKTTLEIKYDKNNGGEIRTDALKFKYGASRKTLSIIQGIDPNYSAPQIWTPQGYSLVWSDEFEGNQLDAKYWTAENGGHGWGNNELQNYTGRKENVDVRDGKLVITAKKENYGGNPVTSGRVITKNKFAFKYGYIVASVKLPKTSKGLWPAFWMMGNDFDAVGWPACGETDILEMGHSSGFGGNEERFLNGACHWGSASNAHEYYSYNHTAPFSVQDGEFHTFTCIWDASYVRMYIDLEKDPTRRPYFEMALKNFSHNEFRKENFILFNLAVGGNFPGIFDIGAVTALSSGSAQMEVDYVRVFQKK